MRTRSIVLLSLVAAVTAGCAKAETAARSTASARTPSASPTATESPASGSPTPEASPLLEEGRNFGFIKSVDPNAAPATVVFDLAYFLTGDDAVQAAKDHGDEYPPPNDYYIVNDNPRLRTVPLAGDAKLVLLDWNHCCDQTFTGDLGDFAMAFDQGELTVGDHVYKGAISPYWLTVKDGVVVKVEEQYLP